ncbi:hypothetical protein KSP40_PGU015603 [Platanthera guangdongensis]|uniref:Nitroreductase domain-containing protein n=1 Tax=Platanthera guangdongensis TaxID=2320717 RepID=A0ABR2LG19_9ASPA
MFHHALSIPPSSSRRLLLRPAASAMHSRHASSPPQSNDDKPKIYSENQREAIIYHNQTKHSLTSGYARGPHGLDWANQPNPFLSFLSAPRLPLLHLPPQPEDSPSYLSLFSSSPPAPLQPISHSTLSRLLYDSLSLSAWKTAGLSTWSLRVNPSSGNLHPTEAHVLSPSLSTGFPFIAHYSPKDHALEIRTRVPLDVLPIPSGEPSIIIALSSIFWREAWKYGERAFRYCNHDVGHAISAVAISAASLGWDTRLLDGLGHNDLHGFLGLEFLNSPPPPQLPDRPVRGRFPWIESQHPDCLLLLFPFGAQPSIDYQSLSSAISRFSSLKWIGNPTSLSKDHVYWDIIYRIAQATKKPLTVSEGFYANPFRPHSLISEDLYKNISVREVVRKRRSAVDMDGVHAMERNTFYQILLHCLPSGRLASGEKQGKQFALPFRTMTWDAEVHAALFVHRVKDLPQGLYFLVRNEEHFDRLRGAMRMEFEWAKPEGSPDGLPLYRLAAGDCKELAEELSCHQDIAADGCFSLGMVARFEPVLLEKNAFMYPRLFWETGVLGQMLYLEAHAVGISATGIGCYFDDDAAAAALTPFTRGVSDLHWTLPRQCYFLLRTQ